MTAANRHEFIFAHEGDARVAASVIMAGMLAVLVGGAYLAIGPRFADEQPVARNGAAAPGAVRVVGGAPTAAEPCDQQVWPHIEQRCLVRADRNLNPPPSANAGPSTVGGAPASDKVAATPPQEDTKLSPLTATPVGHAPAVQNDANSAEGVQEDTAVLRSSETTGAAPRSDLTARSDDELDDMPPPVQKPRKRGHRHFGFHFHFGGFRF